MKAKLYKVDKQINQLIFLNAQKQLIPQGPRFVKKKVLLLKKY